MINIKEYIHEARAFNYNNTIEINDIMKPKLKKEYQYKEKVKTLHFQENYLVEFFGKLTQWLYKNVTNIANQVEKENSKFPESMEIKLPSGLNGELIFDWNTWWTDGVPQGKLRGVEISVSRFCPSSLETSRYYDAKSELESYRLHEEIKINY